MVQEKIADYQGLTFDDVLLEPRLAKSCRPTSTSPPNSRGESA